MLKLLSRILGSPRAEIKDARKIYQKIMEKSLSSEEDQKLIEKILEEYKKN